MRRCCFGILLVGVLGGVVRAAEPVTLVERGGTVVLDNGIVRAEVDRATGTIDQVGYRGKQLLMSPAYVDWVATEEDSEAKVRKVKGVYGVTVDPKTNGGEMADVRFAFREGGVGGAAPAFDVEVHHVVRRGEAGVYSYAVFSHPAAYGDAVIAQSRMVYRTAPALFDTIAVDDARIFKAPPPETPVRSLGPKESMEVTEGPFTGKIFDKYLDFVDAGEHFVHGWMGSQSHLGCWVVDGSTEDHNGGPTKQHNTAHFPQVLLKILTCGHYGAAPVTVAKGTPWEKLYGPWMLYVNEAPDEKALWADAKGKAAALRAAWPYAWLKNPLYPQAAERGTVTGQLHVNDPQDAGARAANAWVGLAEPSPDWQQQSTNYQFWVRADAEGRFSIPNVRAGSYTLYAFVDGVMGEFRKDGVAVGKGETRALGELAWVPVRYGKQVWQIGVADRTAKEFRHGDEFRQYGLPRKYAEEFPHDVVFTIGKSSERQDWNYVQPNVERDGKWVGPTWTVVFDMPAAATGKATLRMAIAGATNAGVQVGVNGGMVGATKTLPHDNSMIREGIHGQYREEDVAFDAKLLRAGENRLTLTLRAGNGELKNVMYDALRLEVGG